MLDNSNEPLSNTSDYSYAEQERDLLEISRKGNSLYQMKMSPGYEILSATLEELRTKATEDLIAVLPGDNERILAAHAVASAVYQTIDSLRNAIDGAINLAKTVPQQLDELKLQKDLNAFPQQNY